MTEQEILEILELLSRRIEQRFPGGEGITPVGLRTVIHNFVLELDGEGALESIDERVSRLMAGFAFAIDSEEG